MRDKKLVRVREVMKTDIGRIDGAATIHEALEKIRRVEGKCLIVEKRHEDDEYGMLLVSDIARKVLAKNRAPERVNVYEIMAKPVFTIDPQMNIRYCARLFDAFEITQAPVIENGAVVGVVSFGDLVLKGLMT